MLSVSVVKKIRKYYYENHYSVTKIAQKLEISRGTVYKYLELVDYSQDIEHDKKIYSKIEPYKDFIIGIIKDDLKEPPKQRHSATRIYDRLKTEFSNFHGSYCATLRYISLLKEKYRSNYYGYFPLEHKPGEAQVDFGDCCFYLRGDKISGKYLVMTFPYSNASYCQLLFNKSAESTVRTLSNIFEYIQGVPHTIWFDNDSALTQVVYAPEKTRRYSNIFKRFILHYNFKEIFTSPYKGNEKGAVEAGVRYLRKNLLVPVPRFDDFNKYNKELLIRCTELQKRKHYALDGEIASYHLDDLQSLNSLPEIQFKPYTIETHVIDKYGRLTLGYNLYYYISPKLQNVKVNVKITPTTVEVYNINNEHIITMERIFGPCGTKYINWAPYIRLLAYKPLAIRNFSFVDLITDINVKNRIIDMDMNKFSKFALNFADYIDEYGLNKALEDIEILIDL